MQVNMMQIEAREVQANIMLARYYSSSLGRFMAVDPAADSAVLDNPQSWNRYSYVSNNPLRFSDPTGQDGWDELEDAGKRLSGAGENMQLAGAGIAVLGLAVGPEGAAPGLALATVGTGATIVGDAMAVAGNLDSTENSQKLCKDVITAVVGAGVEEIASAGAKFLYQSGKKAATGAAVLFGLATAAADDQAARANQNGAGGSGHSGSAPSTAPTGGTGTVMNRAGGNPPASGTGTTAANGKKHPVSKVDQKVAALKDRAKHGPQK